MLFWLLLGGIAVSAQDAFITQWNLSLHPGSGANQIRFNATIATGGAAYTWETIPAGTSGSGTLPAGTSLCTITGIPTGSTISLHIEPQNLQRFFINNGSDRNRLVDVTQWGGAAWISMNNSFYGCENLQITASDIPNLTLAQGLIQMFRGCLLLDGPSNIGSWNTSNVTNMSSMFFGATSFNQPIGSWNTGNVFTMNSMFRGAQSFNQDIGNWNIGNVTNMQSMFETAISFNQDIGNWNTGNVTNMQAMFDNAISFNQPIGNWSTANVGNMLNMFRTAISFDQPIGNWNTTNVTNMSGMFGNAISFNQDIGNWTLNSNVFMTQMFDGSGMSCDSYSSTLIGWSNNPNTPINRSLGAGGLSYGTNAENARNYLINDKFWSVSGDFPSGQSCPPIPYTTLWDMSIPTGESGNENNIGFWATVASGDADYNWETIPSGSSGSGTLTEGTAYRIISGIPSGAMIRLNIMPQNIQQFYMDNTSHRRRLVDIERWGNVVWTSLERAFYGCENLNITADDIPDLSQTTSLLLTFTDCYSLNGPVNIGMWNTENISDMRNTFQNALLFNQDIGSWNTVNVTNMQHLFDGAVAFNQDINNWNLSNVTNVSNMFHEAASFNHSLNNWNTVGVTDMNRMFSGASAFNGQIGLWNTSNVTNMSSMFLGATSFNQPIGKNHGDSKPFYNIFFENY
jgi:surface protein